MRNGSTWFLAIDGLLNSQVVVIRQCYLHQIIQVYIYNDSINQSTWFYTRNFFSWIAPISMVSGVITCYMLSGLRSMAIVPWFDCEISRLLALQFVHVKFTHWCLLKLITFIIKIIEKCEKCNVQLILFTFFCLKDFPSVKF